MSGTVRENIRLALLPTNLRRAGASIAVEASPSDLPDQPVLVRGLMASARDLSQRVGIAEREVADHLEHLERSLAHRGERLITEPPKCLACGFEFTRRHRFTRPSGCPECRGRRVTHPRFRIETKNLP